MSLPAATSEPYPRCKNCGEWIAHPASRPWTHLFTQKEKCYLSQTVATPGYTRGGAHTVQVNVPGRQ